MPHEILKLTKGKLYGDQRDRDELTPKPKKELRPKCPKRFDKAEKKEWRYLKKILENYNLFTVANGPIMEMLAANMVQYRKCAKKVTEQGLLVEDSNGSTKYNLNWQVMIKLQAQITKELQELGLSSTGLAKIGALALKAKKLKKDGMEDLLD